MNRPTRRSVLGAGAALVAAPAARSLPTIHVPRAGRPALVGSSNGLAGMRQVWAAFESGGEPLDAALEVVGVVEADPQDSSVGLGGLPNERCVVQLDAACMHGPTHNSGAVACIENILHPSRVARLVMERTDHCLLVGRGAYEFARAHGHDHVELLTESARAAWLRWKENLSDDDDWLAPPTKQRTGRRDGESAREAAVREVLGEAALEHLHGTIHCSARAAGGDIACTTTTSGLAFKLPGRVGDSPIVGAGLYCDQEAGSAGATGRGEAAILANGSFAIVEMLRAGLHPKDAGMELLKRIVRQVERQARWQPALRGEDGQPSFGVHFYVLGLDGTTAGVTLKAQADRAPKYAVADPDGGPRLETLEPLLIQPD
ncbi:MAG TPA: isoaspartyl peptidase/L-asparaginase [Planctomycetota bacterium]|nr:isoaspartyl peptidase/L-asparaginase [Planctomycetota bacterium]